MKKILLLLLLNIPLLVSSQGISIRTMPVYLGFMYSPDFPYGASNIGVDFHLNEERSIAFNFKLRSIDLVDNGAIVGDLVVSLKKYNHRNFFGTYGMRSQFWMQDGSYSFDEIEYIDKIKRYSIGPEIGFGKRVYFSSYHRLFIDFGLSLGLGATYVIDVDQEKNYDTGNVILTNQTNFVTLFLAPNMMFQIGCKF